MGLWFPSDALKCSNSIHGVSFLNISETRVHRSGRRSKLTTKAFKPLRAPGAAATAAVAATALPAEREAAALLAAGVGVSSNAALDAGLLSIFGAI
mmetsp:Transcript_103041/g.286851  ORF Transcript_103041/g.286851 Transcript_103041/m.286851 type:complete len:96 (+) Transcript_103041:380-667(+)